MFCIECGAKIIEGAKFCVECGKAVPYMNETEKNNVVYSENKNAYQGSEVNQNGKYASYFNFNQNQKSDWNLAINSQWFFREYKEYVYFLLPEYVVTGSGNRRDDIEETCCVGRIHKESGKKEIITKLKEHECTAFSIFDDNIFVWKYNYGVNTIYSIDTNNFMVQKVTEFDDYRVQFVLKNKMGQIIYLLHSKTECYIADEKLGSMQRIDGIDSWDGALIGYNENYVYYNTWDTSVEYACVDLNSFQVVNLSVEMQQIIADRKIYLIDSKKDIIYLENPGKDLTAFDWINKEVWNVAYPNLSNVAGINVNKSIWFNGEYWVCILTPNYETPIGTSIGFVCYNQYGNVNGGCTRKYDGYVANYHTIFSYENIICGTIEVLNTESNNFITNEARGNYDWIYRVFNLQEGKLKAGNKVFRIFYS